MYRAHKTAPAGQRKAASFAALAIFSLAIAGCGTPTPPSAASKQGLKSVDLSVEGEQDLRMPTTSAQLAPKTFEEFKGTGKLIDVPGGEEAPAGERTKRLKFVIEEGVHTNAESFADSVMRTLEDPRGWTSEGWKFVRARGEYDLEVILASPGKTDELCQPLRTYGRLSCRIGSRVVLTEYRWLMGADGYAGDLTSYQSYVVNHEMGHALGKGHEACSGEGQLAPVMLQQTKTLDGCRANPWPSPS